jgi:hypothetical protein
MVLEDMEIIKSNSVVHFVPSIYRDYIRLWDF